jgi:hypothetical protein
MKEETELEEIFLVEELYKLEVEKKNFNWVEFLAKLMKAKTEFEEIFLVEELYILNDEKKNFNWVKLSTKLTKAETELEENFLVEEKFYLMMRRNHQLAHAIDSASSPKKCLQQFALQKNSHSNQTKQQTTLGNCCMAGVRLHQFKIAAGAHFHQFHCTKYTKLIWKQKQKTRTLDQQQQQQQGFPTRLANHILTIISPHPESSAGSQSQPGERISKASTFSSSNQSSSN